MRKFSIQQKIKGNMSRDKTHQEKISIHYGNWFNEEYGYLVENLYREQAARALQRFIRKVRIKTGKTVSPADAKFKPMAADLANGRVNLAPITEPADDKYKEHADKIKQGRYLILDFADPEFNRNLFKALRLNEITLNQMLTAQSLYQAKEWLHDYDYPQPQLREHRFAVYIDDDQGPYKPESIQYRGIAEKAAVFRASLSEDERQYFSINFTKTQEYLFFLTMFKHAFNGSTPPIKPYIKNYLLKCASRLPFESITQKDKFTETANRFFKNIKVGSYLLPTIIGIISTFIPSTISKKDIESIDFLVTTLRLGDQGPTIIISSDYREDDINSPLIAFVLLSENTEKKLQLAVHGSETTEYSPTAGLVTTRLIRALDERPATTPEIQTDPKHLTRKKLTEFDIVKIRYASSNEILKALYGSQYAHHERQARPVEIIHPDLAKNENPHDFFPHDFFLTWHDKVHCWRNGAYFKDFIRHIRSLMTRKGLCQSKDIVMNKQTWILSDMCFSNYFLQSENEDAFIIMKTMLIAIQRTMTDQYENTQTSGAYISQNSDLLLLFFIDIIKNTETWNQFINLHTTEKYNFLEMLTANSDRWRYNAVHHSLEANYLDKPLIALIQKNQDKPNESVILRCKLRTIEGFEKLCDLVDEIGINKFFYWSQNSGLYFHKNFHADLQEHLKISQFSLDSLNKNKLMEAMSICLKKINDQCNKIYNERPNSVIKFIPGSPIFIDFSPYIKATQTQSNSQRFFATESDSKNGITSAITLCIQYLASFHTDPAYTTKCDAIRALLNALVRLHKEDPSMTKGKLANFIQKINENRELKKNLYSNWLIGIGFLFNLSEKIACPDSKFGVSHYKLKLMRDIEAGKVLSR